MEPRIIDRTLCTFCGACVAVCPNRALEIKGCEMTVESVLEAMLKDRPYYEESGGGLTVSGGEPMAQFEFTKELLSAAKEQEIHTCIETCGYAREERFKEIFPLVDLFLFDIKGLEVAPHVKHAGGSNRLIHENLDFLVCNKAQVQLRCPLIPGLNDLEDDLQGLAELRKKYADRLSGIEILPYHNMGVEKGVRIGRDASLGHLSSATEAQ